ncbi:MAG: hypothetical protein P4L31_00240 [Candidatus Babeliales bacterium]|nr:hypothetical protein [Candidatus Babeliales bacterium]
MTKLYKSLRLIALTLFSAFSVASSMHGMQRLRAFTSLAAITVKKQIVNLKPQTKLALAAGTIAAPTAALFYHQMPLQLGATTQAQTPQATFQPKPDEKTSMEERARIAKLIDEHIDEVLQILKNEGTKEFTWLPGYFVKHNASRLDGSKILSDCIKKNELTYVTVPDKWVYAVSKKHDSLRYKDLIVAKKLEGRLDGTMNLAQAQDIATLLKHAKYGKYGYYCDAHSANLLFQTDGRVGFIDTESRGFHCYSYENALWTIYTCHNLHPDAKLFIQNEICKSTDLRWV